MHDAPSITQDLEVQEQQWNEPLQQWDSTDPQVSKAQETFAKAQETFAMKVDRVLLEQDEHFEEQKRKKKILKRAAIPYLDPDVPEIEINRLDSGRWEAKVTLSGGGDTTSLAIRDLLSTTLKMLEELI
jgi:predicted PP-loop superfamily ATPase